MKKWKFKKTWGSTKNTTGCIKTTHKSWRGCENNTIRLCLSLHVGSTWWWKYILCPLLRIRQTCAQTEEQTNLKKKKRLYIQFVAQQILSVSITWAAQFHRHSVWSVPSSRYITEFIRFGILNDWIYSTGKQEELTGCVCLTSPPSCFFPCFDWPPPPPPPPHPLRNSPRCSRPLSCGPPPSWAPPKILNENNLR